jgi:chemotaxis response regulator CheB
MKGYANHVIVLATSRAWISAIQREFPAAMLIWALDENDLWVEAGHYPDSAIIVECTPAADATSSKWLKLVLENQRRLFVVSNIQHRGQAERLRALGVADVLVAISQSGRLRIHIKRHNALAPQNKQTLEQQIQSTLPWRSQRPPFHKSNKS